MSRLVDGILEKASKLGKTIVLAEGSDERIVKGAGVLAVKGIVKVVLLGCEKQVAGILGGTIPAGIKVIDPKTSEKKLAYAELLYSLRKEKGLIMPEAVKLAENPLYFGSLMVKAGDADGMVAGAINSTGDVLRPALQIIKTAPGIKCVSSCFIMGFESTYFKCTDMMIFADCAVNIDPTAEQLADIAMASTASAKSLGGLKSPKVAMLSFSTKGSAKHPYVDKVCAALEIVKKTAPEIDIDGELQVDAALCESVAKLKAPGSSVAGCANVFIFPDLQSGNIGYKLVQRMAGAEAIGPICQGFAKPVNDLSRGCSVDDVVAVAAITAVQAGA